EIYCPKHRSSKSFKYISLCLLYTSKESCLSSRGFIPILTLDIAVFLIPMKSRRNMIAFSFNPFSKKVHFAGYFWYNNFNFIRLRCRHILKEIIETLPDTILDSFFLIIAILFIIFVGLIFFVLGKIPLFRWFGVILITIIKYALLTIFNLLAIGVISGLATIGVALTLALFHYLDWELFMVGNETLIVTHDAFFITAILISLCFVSSILLGTLILSFISLSTRMYIITSYA